MWKGERENTTFYMVQSPLLFLDWNCSQSLATNWNTLSFQTEIIYVGCNLIFKGVNWLVFVTYLVPLYHLVPLSQFIQIFMIPQMYCANCLLSSHALAALTDAARLWRENSIVGLLSWSQAFEWTTPPCFNKAGKGWGDSTPVSGR